MFPQKDLFFSNTLITKTFFDYKTIKFMLAMFAWLKRLRSRKPILVAKDLKKHFVYSSLYLLVIFVLHTIAIIHFEKLSLENSIWFTLTTITTVGYGDVQVDSLPARIATVFLLYIGGIFVLAKTAGDYFEYRTIKHRQKIKGEWRWNMNNHILLISNHEDNISKQYYERLLTEFRQIRLYKYMDIQILTNDFRTGLPEKLQMLRVVHYDGKGNVPEDLEAVNVKQAKIIIVLANRHHDSISDGNTFDILHRLRDANQTASIVVECVDDANRNRLYQAGANIIVRPVRAYPEMIVHALIAPGFEKVIENMLTYQGENFRNFDVTLKQREWTKIVYSLMEAGIGTTMAYISPDGEVHCNPSGKAKVNAKTLIVMVREDRNPTNGEVRAILSKEKFL